MGALEASGTYPANINPSTPPPGLGRPFKICILLSWKRSRLPRHNVFFTDYRDIKFKLTAHRLDSENRNSVLWNKNYRNTAPKITQHHNTANPIRPPLGGNFFLKQTKCCWEKMILKLTQIPNFTSWMGKFIFFISFRPWAVIWLWHGCPPRKQNQKTYDVQHVYALSCFTISSLVIKYLVMYNKSM